MLNSYKKICRVVFAEALCTSRPQTKRDKKGRSVAKCPARCLQFEEMVIYASVGILFGLAGAIIGFRGKWIMNLAPLSKSVSSSMRP